MSSQMTKEKEKEIIIQSQPIASVEDFTVSTKIQTEVKFRLNNVSTGFANGLRRTILSDIECVVIDAEACWIQPDNPTPPKMHNELLRLQLQCIPVYGMHPMDTNIQYYYFKIEEQNETMHRKYVTTDDIQVFNNRDRSWDELANTNQIDFASEIRLDSSREKEKTIFFPRDPITNQGIDIVELDPSESVRIYGTFIVATANENSCYNVVSKCSYGFTVNEDLFNSAKEKFNQSIDNDSQFDALSTEEKDIRKQDFAILNSSKFFVPNSYDFVIRSIGFYSPLHICKAACDKLIQKIDSLEQDQSNYSLEIFQETAMQNAIVITFQNEDYTIGNIVQQMFYFLFYQQTFKVNFCAFSKHHAHDSDSFMVVNYVPQESATSFTSENLLQMAKNDILETFHQVKEKLQVIRDDFEKISDTYHHPNISHSSRHSSSTSSSSSSTASSKESVKP